MDLPASVFVDGQTNVLESSPFRNYDKQESSLNSQWHHFLLFITGKSDSSTPTPGIFTTLLHDSLCLSQDHIFLAVLQWDGKPTSFGLSLISLSSPFSLSRRLYHLANINMGELSRDCLKALRAVGAVTTLVTSQGLPRALQDTIECSDKELFLSPETGFAFLLKFSLHWTEAELPILETLLEHKYWSPPFQKPEISDNEFFRCKYNGKMVWFIPKCVN